MRLPVICLAAFLSALLLSGCISAQPGGVGPSTLPITGKDSYTIVQKDVDINTYTFGILGIPFTRLSPYDAIQNAKSQYGADGLINVTADNRVVNMGISYHTYTIHGDAIKLLRGGRSINK